VLIRFANCITRQIRQNIDWVVRYGGEEFLIVLPETGREGALCLAERLRAAVDNLEINTNEAALHITASFGIAFNLFHADPGSINDVSMETLINQADENLYRSKQGGRNCVSG
jgi:two-component system cell cycle response regulator